MHAQESQAFCLGNDENLSKLNAIASPGGAYAEIREL
jgi:hypothetical protein